MEGAYRFIRNDLGHINNGNRRRGLLAHSVLLFALQCSKMVGVIEQSRWTGDIKTRRKKHSHATTPYTEKEGYKWESVSRRMAQRLKTKMQDVISVCVREADNKLYRYASTLESAGQKQAYIAQNSGRKARTATLDIVFALVTLKVPNNKKGEALSMYYIGCSERTEGNSSLNGHILTNEPVTNKEEALQIVNYYEHRGLVEEYHKVWKTDGTDIESLRMQTKDNIERLVTTSVFLLAGSCSLNF